MNTTIQSLDIFSLYALATICINQVKANKIPYSTTNHYHRRLGLIYVVFSISSSAT
jgi:hypothetical protein